MKDERSVFLLHLPSSLKEQVRELSRENRRSMTKEIQIAIEQRVKCAPQTSQGENA